MEYWHLWFRVLARHSTHLLAHLSLIYSISFSLSSPINHSHSPMFCDPSREYSVKLGILDESNKDAAGLPLTVRSVFILKPDKTVALTMGYPATVGRNFDEILRVIDSLQLTASKSVATPADWKYGEDVLVNFPLSDADADEKFGKDGWRIVEVPSEKGKDLPKHYLRYTKDPSA